MESSKGRTAYKIAQEHHMNQLVDMLNKDATQEVYIENDEDDDDTGTVVFHEQEDDNFASLYPALSKIVPEASMHDMTEQIAMAMNAICARLIRWKKNKVLLHLCISSKQKENCIFLANSQFCASMNSDEIVLSDVAITIPEAQQQERTNSIVPIQLEWKNLTYSVKVRNGCCKPSKNKIILDDISGYVCP